MLKQLTDYLEKEIQCMNLNYDLGELFGSNTIDVVNFWEGKKALANELLGEGANQLASPAIVCAVKKTLGDMRKIHDIIMIVYKDAPYLMRYLKEVCLEQYGNTKRELIENEFLGRC